MPQIVEVDVPEAGRADGPQPDPPEVFRRSTPPRGPTKTRPVRPGSAYNHSDRPELLAQKAAAGAQVRKLLGDPESEAVHQCGNKEGIGGDLAARARIKRRYLEPSMATPGVEVRSHDTILYNSIYHFDDDVLVNPHVREAPPGQNPVLHFRYLPSARTFRHYMRSFDYAWERGRPN
ncbi:hypothetical protein ACFZAU_36645 [Streptomyces sp. NPDC008238]